MAQKAGVDLLLVDEAIKGGMAGWRTLDMKAPKIAERNFEPGFKMDLHIKDLKNALQAGQGPSRSAAFHWAHSRALRCLQRPGQGAEDHSVIFTLIEQMAGMNR